MEQIAHDLRAAVRLLLRARGVAAVAILTLALGIGATTTMFSVVYAALLRPAPFADADRLVVLYITRTTPKDGLVRMRWSRPITDAIAQVTSLESFASFSGTNVAVSGGDAPPEQIDGETIAPAYFRVLRVAPSAGRAFVPEEDGAPGAHPVVMLSDRLWRRRFNADPSILGRTIRVNDVPLTVVGIAPAGFVGLSGKAELWFPRTMAPRLTYSEYLTSPQHFISVVGRLRPRVSLAQANAEIASLGAQFADAIAPPGAQWSAIVLPVTDARVDATVRRSVLVLLGAAGCVLLIACVNVAGLLLARARTRRREIAIRLAIGSSRARLVRQLLVEGLLIAAAAGVAGTLVAYWGVALFERNAPGIGPSFGNDYNAVGSFSTASLDPRVLAFAAAVTLGTTVLCALAPALGASRPDLVPALKEDERGGGRSQALAWLVVSEVGLAVLLLAAAGLLVESFARMQDLRDGFAADRVLTFWIRPPSSRYQPADGPAIVERMLSAIQTVPGVESAAVNRATPFMGGSRSIVFFPDRPVDRLNAPPVGRHYVSADYIRTLGIPLLKGRWLTAGDRSGRPPVAVVNETGARRFWPGERAIGKRVWFGTTTGPFSDPAHAVEIVGVVGDVKYEGLEPGYSADFYTSYLQFSYPDTMVMAKTRGRSAAIVPSLRAAVASVDASVPIFDVMPLDERIDNAMARPRFNAAIVAAFAGAALLLAAIGVYGVLSYSVSSRMREMGVRVALGADRARVVALVLGEGLRLAAIGAAAGTAAALAVTRLMQGLLAGVAASDPRVLAGGAIVMLLGAGVAAWLPARRASAVDPVVVLRDS
jgi:putative ABC transport system permease protein